MPSEPAAAASAPRKRITTPGGTVAELIGTVPGPAPGPGCARNKARTPAPDILFEADLRGADARTALALHTAENDPPVRPFTTTLVEGVVARLPRIDQLIVDCLAPGWTIERMPRVDRSLARIAVWEMLDGARRPGALSQRRAGTRQAAHRNRPPLTRDCSTLLLRR